MILKMKFRSRVSKYRVITMALALAALAATSAWAAGEGRTIGTVLDGDGNPLEGVTVTVTSPDLSTFSATATTKKNGRFVVAFSDAFLTYVYKFEKDGYQTQEVEFKANKSGISRQEFTLHAGVTPTAGEEVTEVASASNVAVLAFNAALEAFNAGDFATAQAKLEETLTADPEIHQAHLLLSEVYAERENYADSAASAEAALALVPGNTDALRLRYQAYRKLGDKEKADAALADYEAAGEAAEEAKRIYNEGVALDKAGDQQGAYEKFLEAAELSPDLTLAQTAIMATAFKSELYEDAAKAAEQILRNDPDNPQALRVRYDSYVKLENSEKRLEALLGLATVDKEFASTTLLNEAAAIFNAGDMATSKPLFEKIIEVDPDQAKVYYFLGLIAVNDGDNATAKQHLAKFVELDPDDPDAGTAKEMIAYL